jgi:hypothetical protein
MKKLLICLFCASIASGAQAQKAKIDTVALLILDRMSNVIGELISCGYRVSASYDLPDEMNGLVKKHSEHEIYMSGPNKMLVNSTGWKGHQEYWYDGEQLFYYSYDENNYAVIKAPATTLQTIDSVNKNYEIDFPAADFFYPTFTDDLIESSDQITLLDDTSVNGKDCFCVLANGKDKRIQIWISNDAFNLPVKYVIVYRNLEGYPQYEATLSDWKVNPNLPPSMFNFMPPPLAVKIRMISISGK